MAGERLPSTLQQAVLATLCFDDAWGALIASQVTVDHFDGAYRDFAFRVLAYRKKYHRPPGEAQIEDLVSRPGAKENAFIARLVRTLIADAKSLNAEYAATRVSEFIRRQTYKAAIVTAGERFQQDDDKLLPDLDRIFHDALNSRQTEMDAGIFLNDPKALRFLNRRQEDFIPLGIEQLDERRIGLYPKRLLLYLAPKGAGKTWFCVFCGKQALVQHLKVAHITLEMPADDVVERYLQAMFAIATDAQPYPVTEMVFDKIIKDKLIRFKTKLVKSELHMERSDIGEILITRTEDWHSKLGGLVVKEFPTSFLTIEQLVGYLDYLELVRSFVPNVLIVDYPKLMKRDRRDDIRVSIGRNMEELRGIAGARNIALVCPHQGTRASIGAARVRSNMASEDISVIQTADTVLTYSATQAEQSIGLGRLSVEHVRAARGGFTLVLTNSFDTGQYVLKSHQQPQDYWDLLPEGAKVEAAEEDDSE